MKRSVLAVLFGDWPGEAAAAEARRSVGCQALEYLERQLQLCRGEHVVSAKKGGQTWLLDPDRHEGVLRWR